ncbi:(d)CMP kinase [Oceanicella actignis]|uniref:Cytidylate kinase n=1 Tax=Oceanicella actignis TaxID=1189325 RepID=A0A1M7SHF7_9RHOB|nr:(d)CMP kinase [Oceanicella actignis]TYO91220.1 cytidylate kinase [Oceanicella actignis]SET19671.1 cytidylate kinase [Oceanicella actignis]SHN57881.1 cytidylate kinase [Oceanicella actignis]
MSAACAGRFVVALDGPAAAGKGTIARALAARFGFAHLDTGLLYRAVGRKALAAGGGAIRPEDAIRAARALRAEDLQAPGLRDPQVGQAASQAAALPEVRAALLDFQRAFAARPGGAVLDGRDIGTVICPDADVKLFVTASDEVRARRRCAELRAGGAEATFEQVLEDLRRRDARDAAREAAPMKPAPDAVLLDTTKLSIDAAVAQAAALIERKCAGRAGGG